MGEHSDEEDNRSDYADEIGSVHEDDIDECVSNHSNNEDNVIEECGDDDNELLYMRKKVQKISDKARQNKIVDYDAIDEKPKRKRGKCVPAGSNTNFRVYSKQRSDEKIKSKTLFVDVGGVLLDSVLLSNLNAPTKMLSDRFKNSISGLYTNTKCLIKARPGSEIALMSYRDVHVELLIFSKENVAFDMNEALMQGELLHHQSIHYVPNAKFLRGLDPKNYVVLTTPEREAKYFKNKSVVLLPKYSFFPVSETPMDEDARFCVIDAAETRQKVRAHLFPELDNSNEKSIPAQNAYVHCFSTKNVQKLFLTYLRNEENLNVPKEIFGAVQVEESNASKRPTMRVKKQKLDPLIIPVFEDPEGPKTETPQQYIIRVFNERYYMLQSGKCYMCGSELENIGGITYRCGTEKCPEKIKGTCVELTEYAQTVQNEFETKIWKRPENEGANATPSPEQKELIKFKEAARAFLAKKKESYDDGYVDLLVQTARSRGSLIENKTVAIERAYIALKTKNSAMLAPKNKSSICYDPKIRQVAIELEGVIRKNPQIMNNLYEVAQKEGALHHDGFVEAMVYYLKQDGVPSENCPVSPNAQKFLASFLFM